MGISKFVIVWIKGLEGHPEFSELSLRVGRPGSRAELFDDGSHCLLILVS